MNGASEGTPLPSGDGTTILLSAERSVRVETWEARAPEASALAWRVAKRTLHGGRQEGVDVIEVDNGCLRFVVVPTRGMSIHRLDMGDIRLGWDSPVREMVHPAFVDLAARGGKGWLDGFNEWMPRAGLAFAGHPGPDGEEMLTLHGRIGNIPASEVSVEIAAGDPARIVVRGLVREVSMFGPNLTLACEISTSVGSNVVRVADRVTNEGARAGEFQLLYHTDYGEPILEDGARFVAAARTLQPFDAKAALALSGDYARYGAPDPDFVEEVFGIVPFADETGATAVMLRNANGTKGVGISYSIAELPFFTLWKNTGARGEAYVTGLEPGTGFPANRGVERRAGRVPVLEPGASRAFTLDFAVLANAPAVAAFATRIEALQGGRTTEIVAGTIKGD